MRRQFDQSYPFWWVDWQEKMLRCKTYIGKHYFDRTDSHTQRLNLRDQWVEMDAAAVIEENNFNVTRQQLDQSNLNKTSPRQMHSPVLVTGRLGCEGLPRQNHANAKAWPPGVRSVVRQVTGAFFPSLCYGGLVKLFIIHAEPTTNGTK